MNKKTIIIIAVIAVLLIGGIIAVVMTGSSESNLAELYNKDKTSYVKYDTSKWEAKTSNGNDMIVSIANPKASINLLSEDAAGFTMDKYIDTYKGVLKLLGADESTLVITDETLGSYSTKVLTYIVKNGDLSMKIGQQLLISNDKLYILTYGSEVDKFEKELPNFKEVLKTFKIK